MGTKVNKEREAAFVFPIFLFFFGFSRDRLMSSIDFLIARCCIPYANYVIEKALTFIA